MRVCSHSQYPELQAEQSNVIIVFLLQAASAALQWMEDRGHNKPQLEDWLLWSLNKKIASMAEVPHSVDLDPNNLAPAHPKQWVISTQPQQRSW